MKRFIGIVAVLSAIGLTACESSSSNNSSAGSTTSNATALGAIATKSADSDPSAIGNATSIQQDLATRFGGSDSEPVQLQQGESLSNLLGRLNP